MKVKAAGSFLRVHFPKIHEKKSYMKTCRLHAQALLPFPFFPIALN